jgi:hypothetical protein
LTQFDECYYSNKENMFFVSAKGCNKPSYVKVSSLRQYWKDADSFDNWLIEKIMLKPDPNHREDHKIWEGFQYKFGLTYALYNYYGFFKKILLRVMKDMIKELVTVVEVRHIFGDVFDDDQNKISLKEELKIFSDVQAVLRSQFPLFQIRIIVVGLKVFGKEQIQGQIDRFIEADSLTNMVAGFDLVCEEDYNPKCDAFLE